MDRLGFIHEKLDIKILILYILRRLSWYVDPVVLSELCQCDGGVGYFDYSDCLTELIETGQIEEAEEGLRITEKGAANVDAVESSLPYSVRAKARKELQPVNEKLERAALIKATHEVTPSGCIVSLKMGDGMGELIDLKLLCSGEEQAKKIKRNFRNNAEEYYQKIADLLSEEK